MESQVAPYILRAALEEHIRFGPKLRQPVEVRLCERLPGVSATVRAEALVIAQAAVDTAYTLAREYQAGKQTQAGIVAELRRRYPWLTPPVRAMREESDDLAQRLGHFGYYLAIY